MLKMVEGLLSIDEGSILIEEPPMSVYERFYKLFMAGMAEAKGEDSFIENWVWCAGFRNLMIQALVVMGIENPEDLKPSVLEQLLFTYEGGAGAIFQLCNTFPKLTRETQNQPLSHQKSPNLQWSGIISYIRCNARNWLISLLSALS